MIAIAVVSVVSVDARSPKHGLDQDAALNLLFRTLKEDRVYDKRISLDCVTFGTDEITRAYFEFALHEKHNAKCGGDPETTPIVDRYRVHRGSGKIELYDVVKDSWQPYKRASDR